MWPPPRSTSCRCENPIDVFFSSFTQQSLLSASLLPQVSARRSSCQINFNVVLNTAPTTSTANTLSSYLTSSSSTGLKSQLNTALVALPEYDTAPVTTVAVTSPVALITPAPTSAPTSAPTAVPTMKSCQEPKSVEQCQRCLVSDQCKEGYCCPYMKLCVPSSTTGCRGPIANCRPMCYDSKVGTSACTCSNADWQANKWAPPTCTAASPTAAPTPASAPADNEATAWINAHNYYQCLHGSPDLVWSAAMATDAQSYADSLGTQMKHSDSYKFAPPLGPAGENLAMGYGTLESATSAWYNEVNDCTSLPGCTTGNGGAAVGHFTALIWKG